MNPEESERMNQLVKQIQTEKDHKVFMELVEELNALLERKEERLQSYDHPKS
jgi:hypothetical protein